MKTVKRIAAVLLAVMLMAPAAVHAAAPSVKQININKKKATATVTYNKKKQLPTVITVNGQKLVVGKDCIILKKKKSAKKNAGTYKITIKGIGNYYGTTTVTYKINISTILLVVVVSLGTILILLNEFNNILGKGIAISQYSFVKIVSDDDIKSNNKADGYLLFETDTGKYISIGYKEKENGRIKLNHNYRYVNVEGMEVSEEFFMIDID